MLFSPFNFLSKYNKRKSGNISTKWVGREFTETQWFITGIAFFLISLGLFFWPFSESSGSTFKFLSFFFALILLSSCIGLFVLGLRLIHSQKYVKLGISPKEEEPGKIHGITILDDELEIILQQENQMVEIASVQNGEKLVVCIGYDERKESYFLIIEDKKSFNERESRKYYETVDILRSVLKSKTNLVPELFVER